MRRVILQMGMSLDGCTSHPPAGGEHPDVVAWKLASLAEIGTHIMGRVTYAEMSSYWPTATGVYAAPMNDTPKVVFSGTVDRADWPETSIAAGPLADEIARLKALPGKDIMAHGGHSFVQALSRQGLVDEYRLVIHPIAMGDGPRLFAGLPAPLHLRLMAATTYPDGTAIHVYRPSA